MRLYWNDEVVLSDRLGGVYVRHVELHVSRAIETRRTSGNIRAAGCIGTNLKARDTSEGASDEHHPIFAPSA